MKKLRKDLSEIDEEELKTKLEYENQQKRLGPCIGKV